jgi:hypothetical protein
MPQYTWNTAKVGIKQQPINHINKHQGKFCLNICLQDMYQDCQDWLNSSREKVELCADTSGDKMSLQNKLERLKVRILLEYKCYWCFIVIWKNPQIMKFVLMATLAAGDDWDKFLALSNKLSITCCLDTMSWCSTCN